jgi:hypothetical protein
MTIGSLRSRDARPRRKAHRTSSERARDIGDAPNSMTESVRQPHAFINGSVAN